MTRTRHGEVELEAVGSNEEGLSMSLAPWRVIEGELLMVDVGESVAVASLRVLSQSSWRWTRASVAVASPGISRRISCRRTRASDVPPFEADANGQARRWPSDTLHPYLHVVLNAGSGRLNLFWLQELHKYLAF
jgi:hypothetical protein